MKIISLLGILAVLSFMIVPAFSQPSLGSCFCMPDDCHGNSEEDCCSRSSDSSIFPGCACTGIMTSYSGMEYYDPGYSYLSKRNTRSPARTGQDGLTGSVNIELPSLISSVAPNNAGPPDPDVVEYLPPSAKQVLQVLASYGPLTQKDIIGKTDLPPRTVRYALGRLRGEEMLEERFCFRDARQSLYYLTGN